MVAAEAVDAAAVVAEEDSAAALVVDQGFGFGSFAEHLSRRLPVYAIPVFVRLCRALDATETFKQQKQRLVREGFNPLIADDPLFFRDPATGDYRPIDRIVYARIAEAGSRFWRSGPKAAFSKSEVIHVDKVAGF